MSLIEIVLITIGVSLDIFATVECQGAVVAKLEKKQLAMAVTLIAVWQTIALLVGGLLVTLLNRYDVKLSDEAFIGRILAILIFLGLGLRMFVKAWRNEKIVEKRQDSLNIKKTFLMIAQGTIFTVLTGIAFGFLETDLRAVLIMIICVTIAMVVFGLYTGYRLGFEQKSKAYILGGALLIVAGIDVIVRFIVLK